MLSRKLLKYFQQFKKLPSEGKFMGQFLFFITPPIFLEQAVIEGGSFWNYCFGCVVFRSLKMKVFSVIKYATLLDIQ